MNLNQRFDVAKIRILLTLVLQFLGQFSGGS